MNGQHWYPAATLSALLLSCGGATSDDNAGKPGSTGGTTNIDSGVPAATGGQAGHFYGMMMVTGGTNAGFGGAPDAGIGGVDSFTGGTRTITPPTGGRTVVTVYGPRFDKLASSSLGTGGNHAHGDPNAEGGAGANGPHFDPLDLVSRLK